MKLFGIPVSLHWTYWIMIAFTMSGGILTLDYVKMITDAAMLFALTLLVIGHELSHALMARKFGYQTLGITMHLLGGIAMINMNRIKPREEFWIALAGPAFNLALGIPALVLFILNPGHWLVIPCEPESIMTWAGVGVLYFTVANLVMGLFNLIPAYPMDGGRIIRSLLSHLNRVTVLNISNGLSLFFAAVFIVFGLATGNPMIMFLGGVLIFLVWAERKKMILI